MVVKEEHILLQDQTARHTGGQPDTQVDSQTQKSYSSNITQQN